MAAQTYWVRFGSANPASNTGLTPTFIKFLNSAGLPTTAPSISEPGAAGLYSFSYDPQGTIVFIMDGGVALTSTDRYVTGTLDLSDKIAETGATLAAMGSTLSFVAAQGMSTLALDVATSNLLQTTNNNVTAAGSTQLAIGNTLAALNTYSQGMGTSLAAQGVTLLFAGAGIAAMGTSLTAQGASLIAVGDTLAGMNTTLSAVNSGLTNQGETLVAMGDTLATLGGQLSGIGDPTSPYGDASTDPTTLFGFLKRIQELQEGNSIYTKSSGAWAISTRDNSTVLRTKTLNDTATTVEKA